MLDTRVKQSIPFLFFICTLILLQLPIYSQSIQLSDHSEVGSILTDTDGNTLYYFTRDVDKGVSVCNGGCATAWPIFYVEDLSLSEGLDSADFSTITRDDGSFQTAYKDWPLYYYVDDAAPGDINGEAVGNVWFVAKPDYTIMLMDNQLTGRDGVNYDSNYEPGDEIVQYFTDAYGRTIYIFIPDTENNNNFTRPDFSNDPIWPIYGDTTELVVPTTLDSSLFDLIDVFGRPQLTYKGWPLYYFGPDSLRGQNIGVSVPRPGVWPVAVKDLEPAANVVLDNNDEVGSVLTDATGNTLYFFTRDVNQGVSVCNGGCEEAWPVFYLENPSLGTGLDSADFSTITRDDGSLQTAYKDWPLYYFAGDSIPGDIQGEGRGNVWFVAKPDYTFMLMDNQLVGRDGVNYNGAYEPGDEIVQYFTDAYGRTIYIFIRDNENQNNFTRPDFSNDPIWPIYGDTNTLAIPSTLDSSLFALIDVFGRPQWTYKGWPLYYFGPDSLRGQNIGVSVPAPGVWPVAVKDLAPAANVVLASNDEIGSILTDAEGNTLYFFTRDTDKGVSFCNGNCENAWPVFYVESPNLGSGLDSADFSTIMRDDGSLQTAYKDWPLYYYVNDSIPGDINGEARGNVWFVAKPDYTFMLMDNQLVGRDGVNYTGEYEPGDEVVQYFTDAYGRTIYVFVNDTENKNNFTAEDFSNDPIWPIYGPTMQSIPTTLDSALFDVIDVFGRPQLTYKGWPLYYFGPDSTRGQTLGVSVPSPGIWPVAIRDIDSAMSTSVIGQFQDQIAMQLAPNPVVDLLEITINTELAGRLTLGLMSVTGQTVELTNRHQIQSGYNRFSISVDHLAEGLYILQISLDGQLIAQDKIIKLE